MASALTRKSWTDLTRRPLRTILTVLTLALAVASFGILAMPSLMNRAMAAEVARARLYDIAVPIDDVALSADQLRALRSLPNVAAVTARSTFTTRALIGTRRVDTELWGVPDFADQPVDQVLTAARPGAGQLLVDTRDAASGISNAKAGTSLTIQSADGTLRQLPVVGSARGMGFNQATLAGRLVLYADQATVQGLGGLHGVNVLELRLQDAAPAAAQSTVEALRTFLAAQPSPSGFADIPTIRAPGDWPLKEVFNSRAKILDILIVLAVLSAVFLLANTIRTLVAEQTREIGVMRAVGASGRDVRNAYLRTAALVGALGSAVGAILGIGLAALLTRLFAQLIFGVTPGLAVEWPVVLLGAVAGVAGTLLTAWPTLHRVLRTPVHAALADEGIVSAFGDSRLDRAVMRSGALPPPVRLGFRSVARQKGRSATTILQVAIAVATLLGLLSLALAVSQVTDRSWDTLDYDISLTAQQGGSLFTAADAEAIRSQPGVEGVEPAVWSQMTHDGTTLYALGIHPASYIRERVASGRWLTAADEASAAPVAVIGPGAARAWHLHPGSQIAVMTAAGPATITIVGIGGSQADNGYRVYTTLATAGAAIGHPAMSNSLLVRTTDKSHAGIDATAARLETALAQSGHPTRSGVLYAGRATDKATSRSMLTVVEAIGLLIVAISMLGLVNAVTMSIIERTREIGVLRCLGARARDLRRIFRAETLVLALVGFVLAVPLGWIVARALQWMVLHIVGAQLPAPYTLRNLAIALIGTLVLALLVVIAPLRRATHLRPGDAIRYR